MLVSADIIDPTRFVFFFSLISCSEPATTFPPFPFAGFTSRIGDKGGFAVLASRMGDAGVVVDDTVLAPE